MINWRKYASIVSFAILAFHAGIHGQELSVKDFASGIRSENAQILDVRTPEEFNTGYIAGAFLADWNDPSSFNERIKYLDKTKPVYVYCLSGVRSAAAADKIKASGFTEVYSLKKGLRNWKSESMPLRGPSNTEQITLRAFQQSIPEDSTVLLDIGAAWCPPCKHMEPVIRDVESSLGATVKIIRIDAGEQFELTRQLEADELPTFIIYRRGKEVWRTSGITTKETFLEHLK